MVPARCRAQCGRTSAARRLRELLRPHPRRQGLRSPWRPLVLVPLLPGPGHPLAPLRRGGSTRPGPSRRSAARASRQRAVVALFAAVRLPEARSTSLMTLTARGRFARRHKRQGHTWRKRPWWWWVGFGLLGWVGLLGCWVVASSSHRRHPPVTMQLLFASGQKQPELSKMSTGGGRGTND